MQSSFRLTAFDSTKLVLSIRRDLKILMTSGGGESKMAGRTYPTGTDLPLGGPLKFHLKNHLRRGSWHRVWCSSPKYVFV